MKSHTGLYYILLFFSSLWIGIYAQKTGVSGVVVTAIHAEKLVNSTVTIEKTALTTTTAIDGTFYIDVDILPDGIYTLVITAVGYTSSKLPFTIHKGKTTTIGTIVLAYEHTPSAIATLQLSDQDLMDTDHDIVNVSSALHAAKTVFHTAAAFDFSTAFFRPRGQGSTAGKVLINGIEMNTLSRGKPHWSTWGGLNTIQRNQEFIPSLTKNAATFGDLAGSTHITMRASQYRPGVHISYATANKTYTGRVMGTYTSGLLATGWAYTISASRRFGNEGSIEGTFYDANSFYIGVEKKWKRHAIHLMGMYTPNRSGRSTAITEEVYQLRGRSYNPNWGYQEGKMRNARIQKVNYPSAMLTHYWNITTKTQLQTNLWFQSGSTSNSRIDAGGTDMLQLSNGKELFIGGGSSADTNPMHPTVLPSFHVQSETPTALDFQHAFVAQQRFQTDGQLNWNALITANQHQTQQGHNATYITYEDTMENTILHGNILLNSTLNDHFSIQGTLDYRTEQQTHYAKITDLLGGTGFLDIDRYAETDLTTNEGTAQSDLRHPNRIVTVGNRYKYQYIIDASVAKGFIQTQYTGKHMEGALGGCITQTQYQRTGIFENGYFPGTASFGKSSTQQFFTYGIKGELTYKLDWRNAIHAIVAHYTKAPTIAQTFTNPRQNNSTVTELIGEKQSNENITTFEANYTHRSSKLRSRITGYYTKSTAATDLSFFFTQALAGNQSAFVQQIITNMDKTYIGAELGIAYQITPTLTLKSAVAIGQHTYANTPNLMLTSTSEALAKYNGTLDLGTTALQSYRLATGPQQVAQLGFQYRDPKYWWFGCTANYFAQSYSAISPLARTANFSQDVDGLPFNDYDTITAKQLLQQEEFDPYLLVNATAGTSWRIKKYSIGLFVAIQNVFNQDYKTGGFESARMANYRLALAESKRKTPVYGARYYYGAGTTYYLNVYLKF